MDILDPPKAYIDFRCAIRNANPEQFQFMMKKFYESNRGTESEIIEFCNWVHESRHNGTLPSERVEIREMDGKKHGRVVPMMIYDIDYEIRGKDIIRRKIYVPLGPIYDAPIWGKEYSFYNEGRMDRKRNRPLREVNNVIPARSREELPAREPEDEVPF